MNIMNNNEVRIVETNIDPKIAEAIFKTSQSIKQLSKSDKNPFGHFNYVSIDKYYEEVARIALKNDLTWSCKEVSTEVLSPSSDKPVIRFTYMFTLIHKSGVCVPAIDILSIYHGWQGAQTAGSAGSYAEKLFMRKMFKVITGENDADATDPDLSFGEPSKVNDDTPAVAEAEEISAGDLDLELPEGKDENNLETPEDGLDLPEEDIEREAIQNEGLDELQELGQEAEKALAEPGLEKYVVEEDDGFKIFGEIDVTGEEKWNIVYECFKTFMPEIKKAEDTMEWWNKNNALLTQMEDEAPKTHKKITRLFKTAYTKLEKK